MKYAPRYALTAAIIAIAMTAALAPYTRANELSPNNPPPFENLVEAYLNAYGTAQEPRTNRDWIYFQDQITDQVFEHAENDAADYIGKMQYLESLHSNRPYAIEALYDALEAQWRAAYGKRLLRKLDDDPIPGTRHLSLSERKAARVRIGEDAGALVGYAAFKVLALTMPSVIPLKAAAFRAVWPVTGFVGGFLLGGKTARTLNESAILEYDIPVAPAHVMHLGINSDEKFELERSMARSKAPMIAGLAVAETIFPAQRQWVFLQGLIKGARALRTAGLAAAAAEVEIPPAMLLSTAASLSVTAIADAVLDRAQYETLLQDLFEARRQVTQAIERDSLSAFRASSNLIGRTIALTAFIDQKELHSHRELSGDADWTTYQVLDLLESAGPRALMQTVPEIEALPPATAARAKTYLQSFATYRARKTIESHDIESGAKTENEARLYSEYLSALRKAKDQSLAQSLVNEKVIRHSGHLILQTAVFLRATRVPSLELRAQRLIDWLKEQSALGDSEEHRL